MNYYMTPQQDSKRTKLLHDPEYRTSKGLDGTVDAIVKWLEANPDKFMVVSLSYEKPVRGRSKLVAKVLFNDHNYGTETPHSCICGELSQWFAEAMHFFRGLKGVTLTEMNPVSFTQRFGFIVHSKGTG